MIGGEVSARREEVKCQPPGVLSAKSALLKGSEALVQTTRQLRYLMYLVNNSVVLIFLTHP